MRKRKSYIVNSISEVYRAPRDTKTIIYNNFTFRKYTSTVRRQRSEEEKEIEVMNFKNRENRLDLLS